MQLLHCGTQNICCVYLDLYWIPSLCDVMCDVMWCFVLAVVYRYLLPVSWFLMDPIPLWCDVWHNVVFCLGGSYYWFCSRVYVLFIFPDMLPSHIVFDYSADAENLEYKIRKWLGTIRLVEYTYCKKWLRCVGLFLVNLWAVTHICKCQLLVLMSYILQTHRLRKNLFYFCHNVSYILNC